MTQVHPAAFEVNGLTPVSEKAKVPNAHESTGQDVQEESPDELATNERRRALLIVTAPIAIGEAHLGVGDVHDPMVGDGDAVGVAPEIVEHLLRPGEWTLRVDHPVDDLKTLDEVAEGVV